MDQHLIHLQCKNKPDENDAKLLKGLIKLQKLLQAAEVRNVEFQNA